MPEQSTEVRDAIEYFNSLWTRAAEFDLPPSSLFTQSEAEWITHEIGHCIADFPYAARNYFWIVDKQSREWLLNLWEPQELLWEMIQGLWRQGRPAWVVILKARQLGFSTLIQSIMAWDSIFHHNRTGLLVADDPQQATALFQKLLYIYDRLPWWMQPMIASRRFQKGIIFDNPDTDLRGRFPGLNSRIVVQSANKLGSVGRGQTLNVVHLSEYSSYLPDRAAQILEADVEPACVNQPGNLLVIESTASGVGNPMHELWENFSDKGRDAKYFCFFGPALFDVTLRRQPPPSWEMDYEMKTLREEFALEWMACRQCGLKPPAAWIGPAHRCARCGSEDIGPCHLDDDQIYWYYLKLSDARSQDRGRRIPVHTRRFYQEFPITAAQAFQASGVQVFPDEAVQWVQSTIRQNCRRGIFDDAGAMHYNDAVNEKGDPACSLCGSDHSHGALRIWQAPEPGATYSVAADTSEGNENSDFAVITVIKLGPGLEPDEEVADWRARTRVGDQARTAYLLGRYYNNALLAVEAVEGTGYLVHHMVANEMGYPNMYQWKHLDSPPDRVRSSKRSWVTNSKTRRALFAHTIAYLCSKSLIVRSPRFLAEMLTCVQEDEDAKAQAEKGKYDDKIFSLMIASFILREEMFDSKMGRSRLRSMAAAFSGDDVIDTRWDYSCDLCHHQWASSVCSSTECPQCHSLCVRCTKRAAASGVEDTLFAVKSAYDDAASSQGYVGSATRDFFDD